MRSTEQIESKFKDTLLGLIDSINDPRLVGSSVIEWASPILSFGNPMKSSVATLGLNPSNLEFVDFSGNELEGLSRRFHTLNSLELDGWKSLGVSAAELILEKCYKYFDNNPYDAWFKKLDFLISGAGFSYYFPFYNACHLDLVPYATEQKWSSLNSQEKLTLLEVSGNSLGLILRESNIDTLILNGQSVVDAIQIVSDITFMKEEMLGWNLPRKSIRDVSGYSYSGVVEKIGEISLGKAVKILGFNHNIQSSFGVTNIVQSEIRKWIKMKLDNGEI